MRMILEDMVHRIDDWLLSMKKLIVDMEKARILLEECRLYAKPTDYKTQEELEKLPFHQRLEEL